MAGAAHRIAVVIPCYNDGTFLRDALASVREQEACELVVVDDGSTEEATLTLLDRLSNGGVRILRQANSGVASARMAGVYATSARYIYPLDADDLIAPGALTPLADALDGDPRLVAGWGDVEVFGAGDATMRLRTAVDLDPWLITYVNDLPLGALLRRDALLSVGGWKLRDAHEDWDVWMAFAEQEWMGIRLDRIVEIHREHAGRRWARLAASYPQADEVLRHRHPSLFAQRPRNWRRSRAPWRSRLGLPLIGGLHFVPDPNKQRLYQLVHHPARLLEARLRRVRQRLRHGLRRGSRSG
jgi:glycosyltransferase involved in cell wall biosynthesis